jgi:WD40 repeat protein
LSALPFSPSGSLVAKQYIFQFSQLLSVEMGEATDWPITGSVLEGHTDHVWSVSFSPDGK